MQGNIAAGIDPLNDAATEGDTSLIKATGELPKEIEPQASEDITGNTDGGGDEG